MTRSGHNATDPSGLETLEMFAQAPRFNQWLYGEIAPFCKGTILEIGSGIGNISGFLLKDQQQVVLSDLRTEYCHALEQRFSGNPHLQEVLETDLACSTFEQQYPHLLNRFNTIIALNVVEHIENHGLALENCRRMLQQDGHLIVLVPAYQGLYNKLDRELDHFRRYNQKSLSGLMQSEGFKVIHQQYFNMAGIFGWWFTGSILKKQLIPGAQLRIFEKLVPLFKIADLMFAKKVGLSVIAIGKLTSKN